MGLLSALGITSNNKSVKAQYAPAVMNDGYGFSGVGNTFGYGPMDRALAMQVPAVANKSKAPSTIWEDLPLS